MFDVCEVKKCCGRRAGVGEVQGAGEGNLSGEVIGCWDLENYKEVRPPTLNPSGRGHIRVDYQY